MGGQSSKKESSEGHKVKEEVDSICPYQFNNHLPRSKRKWQQYCLNVPNTPIFVNQMQIDELAVDEKNIQNIGYFALLPSELIFEVLSFLFQNQKSTIFLSSLFLSCKMMYITCHSFFHNYCIRFFGNDRMSVIKHQGIPQLLHYRYRLFYVMYESGPLEVKLSTLNRVVIGYDTLKKPPAMQCSFIGPPGCGKTSLIQSLFIHYGINSLPLHPTPQNISDKQYFAPLLLTFNEIFSAGASEHQNDLECILVEAQLAMLNKVVDARLVFESNVVCIVFDINTASLKTIQQIVMPLAHQHQLNSTRIYLIGTKCDLCNYENEHVKVLIKKVTEYANSANLPFIQTSTVTQQNLSHVAYLITNQTPLDLVHFAVNRLSAFVKSFG